MNTFYNVELQLNIAVNYSIKKPYIKCLFYFTASRRKRQVNLQPESNTYTLETTDTSITIENLSPDTTYTVGVVAETSAGRGINVEMFTIQTGS